MSSLQMAILFMLASMMALANRLPLGKAGWLFDLAVHFTPHLIVAGGAICLFCLWQQRQSWALVVVFFMLPHLISVISFSSFATPSSLTEKVEEKKIVRVASANLWQREKALEALALMSKAQNADVITLLEAPRVDCAKLYKLFPGHQFCTLVNETSAGNLMKRPIAVLSKTEPKRIEVYTPQGLDDRAILNLEYTVDEAVVQIVATHPPAPGYPTNMVNRDALMMHATKMIDTEARYIFMGDFNMTPWSKAFRAIPGKRAGDPRLVSTWLTKLPLLGLPIDHIFFGGSLTLLETDIGGATGSDHRPIFASFAVK